MNDYLSSEILKLKINLMDKTKHNMKYSISNSGERKSPSFPSKSNKSSISDIIEREIAKKLNSKTGKIFEENIRKCLKINLDWKKGKIKRKFFYREISFKNKKRKFIICPNKNTNLSTKEGYYTFTFNVFDNSCEILNTNTGEVVKKINENNNAQDVAISDKIISIGKPNEFEIDGLFKIKGFDLLSFDEEEIEIIHNNINENLDYSYAAIEIKLSYKKIPDMIMQLIKKKKILEKIFKKPILYLGFVTCENAKCENANVYKEIPVDFNCLILCVKNGMFFGRKMTEKIDWKLVEKVEGIEKKVEGIEKRIEGIEKKIEGIEKKIEGIEKKIEERFEGIEKKINSLFSLLKNK